MVTRLRFFQQLILPLLLLFCFVLLSEVKFRSCSFLTPFHPLPTHSKWNAPTGRRNWLLNWMNYKIKSAYLKFITLNYIHVIDCKYWSPCPCEKWDPVHKHFQNICPTFQQKLEWDQVFLIQILSYPHRKQSIMLRNGDILVCSQSHQSSWNKLCYP